MKSSLKYAILSFCFLFAAHLLRAANRTEADSTKNKYALNDPRNPDCPCHRYQALADKEYTQLLQKSGQGGKLQAGGEGLSKSTKPGKVRSRNRFRDRNHGQSKKVRKKKRFGDRLSRCFHF